MSTLINDLNPIFVSFWGTIRLAMTAAVFSLALGVALAIMRVSPVPVLRGVGTLYVTALRNTPLTLVLLFCGLGLGATLNVHFSTDNLSLDNFWLAIVGLSAYTSAFVCEALRSGINTVPLGQVEAARSLGLTFAQTARTVVLPQAFRAVIAPIGSIMIALTKNTTVVYVVGYLEASRQMKLLFDEDGASIPVFIGFAFGFMVLTLPIGLVSGWLAKRFMVAR